MRSESWGPIALVPLFAVAAVVFFRARSSVWPAARCSARLGRCLERNRRHDGRDLAFLIARYVEFGLAERRAGGKLKN